MLAKQIDQVLATSVPESIPEKFTKEFSLSYYDANILVDEKGIALYFNALCNCTKNYKAAANFVMGSVKFKKRAKVET